MKAPYNSINKDKILDISCQKTLDWLCHPTIIPRTGEKIMYNVGKATILCRLP